MSPPSAGVRRAGDCQPREGGIGTCPVSPQAPRAVSASPTHPPPGAREGKGREEGEESGRWVFPGLPEEELGLGVPPAGFGAAGSLSPSGSASSSPRAWRPRGLPRFYRLAVLPLSGFATGSPPLAAPLGLHSRGCATPSHAQARGAQHPRPRARCLCAPARAPASPRQVPRFSRSCPVTRQSSCLGDSSLPPPGSACPLASSFRSLSVPHPLRLSLQPPLRFPSSADLSLATPPWKHGAPGARLAPSGVEPTGGSTRRF